MRLIACALVAVCAASASFGGCGASSGTAPTIALSTQLADGLSCRDAAAPTIELPHVLGDAGPLAFICFDTEAPQSVMVAGLPFARVEVLAVSGEGAPLYRGQFDPARYDLAATISVVLYPDAAR